MSTKYYGQAEQAGQSIVNAFQGGNLPKALAPLFIKRNKNDMPSLHWSWANQLIAAMHGCTDARAFGQWIDVKRCVRKGEKAKCFILAPCGKKKSVKDANGNDQDKMFIYGFRGVPVFDVSQTDGEPLPPVVDNDTQTWINNLPLREVAESWGLSISVIDSKKTGANGWYQFKTAIGLGVKNLATWCHELVHAADDKRGTLTERGQFWSSEIVAELGGAILLCILGNEVEADLGGCWDYVKRYATDANIDPITACTRMLKRTCDAVALILETADSLTNGVTNEFVNV